MNLKLSIGVVLLSLSASAFADTGASYQPGEFYFAPGVAYYHFSEKRDLQNAAMANLSAGLVVSDQFSLEAFYGQAATKETPASLDESTRFYMYSGEGVYHFNADANAVIHPYMLAGLSITDQEDDSDSAGNTTLLGINAGVGIEYFVNSNISLYTDARDIYTLSGGQNDWMLNAGIKFLFDGHSTDNKTTEASVPPVETNGSVGFYELQASSKEEE